MPELARSIGPVARHRSVLWCAPQPPAPYESWGEALLRHRLYDAAIAKFSSANAFGPNWADPLEHWGEALAAKRDYAGAAEKFEQRLAVQPHGMVEISNIAGRIDVQKRPIVGTSHRQPMTISTMLTGAFAMKRRTRAAVLSCGSGMTIGSARADIRPPS